jgi:regulator of RNase E activity RraA
MNTFSSCDFADALVNLGHKSCFIPSIKRQAGPARKVIGRAFTQTYDLISSSRPALQGPHILDSIQDHIPSSSPAHDWIVCISAPKESPSACFGGLMAARALHQPLLGPRATLCVNGARVRDTRELDEFGWTVFAPGTSSMGGRSVTKLVAVGEDLVVDTALFAPEYNQVRIKFGDLIVMDEDGVVVCPASMVDQVIEKCRELVRVDDLCMADLKQGKGITETFQKYRGK